MRKKISIAIVYNEPTVQTKKGRKFITEAGILQDGGKLAQTNGEVITDLSAVGVLEEKEEIARALQSLGYKSTIFNVDSDICRFVNFLKEEKPDLVFNLCESVGNESLHEMHAAAIYELMGIPYTGSSALTLGLALNKVRVKEMLLFHGLPTPLYQVVKSPIRIALDESMTFPLIVKPSSEDASIGIETESVVENLNELRKRVRYIIEHFDQPALVEEYIDGRELNVGIIGDRKPIVLPISEIDMSTLPDQYHRIITYNAKWMKGTEEYEHTKGVCPALLPAELEATIKEMALKAYQLLSCRDYARVDLRLSKDHQPYILEVNPNPDISDDAGFARSVRGYGFTFEQLIAKIIECALERTP
ncbi:MAG: ATP-grasp domain-containing protein [Ignavibacteriae bacterium]|nr:ATP-grasp domain-containing protein [Ignavibacteriota bacterium]